MSGVDSIGEIRVLLRSPDERTRALAARSICPCHGSFEPLRQLSNELRQLAFDDPSQRVRGEAKHVLRDALVVNLLEEEKLLREERKTAVNERAARRQAAADNKQLRRERSRRASGDKLPGSGL
jgi:hypothetical protein